MNCWEFMKCGREKGGSREAELGVCPAWPDHGRHCARVSGTLCGGRLQGSYAQKQADCLGCEYYQCPHYDIKFRGEVPAK